MERHLAGRLVAEGVFKTGYSVCGMPRSVLVEDLASKRRLSITSTSSVPGIFFF